ncbi:MAG: hypothetical protein U1E52_09365 [Geminicoccaceae bacterium]
MVDGLAEEFEAPRATISGDVRRMLQDLADQGFLAVEAGMVTACSAGASLGASRRWGCSPRTSPIAAAAMPLLQPARGLERAAGEFATADWCRVLDEAAGLGVLRLHLSGEPTARGDLEQIVTHARDLGLLNLITAGVLLDEKRIKACATPASITSSSACRGPSRRSRTGSAAIAAVTARSSRSRAPCAAGLPLTINAVVHRRDLDQLQAMVDLAVELDAHQLEVAHVQYYGWALLNRAALMPTRTRAARGRDRNRRALAPRAARAPRYRLCDPRLLGQAAQAAAWAAGAAPSST